MARNFLYIGKSIDKSDNLALLTAREKYTDDIGVENPLYCVFLYSTFAHAKIETIDTSSAGKLPGVIKIFTWENTTDRLFTTAGQGFPEPSPYDTRLFDRTVRYVGDRVAMVAAESEETAREAAGLIEVSYQELEPVFDTDKAVVAGAPVLHSGDEFVPIPVPYKPEKNIAAEVNLDFGETEKGLEEADFVEDHNYSMHYASHCATEPHAVAVYFDERGRMVIVSTTQVPFHVRRIVSRLLDIPLKDIRVIKPRIGGGFGGKQEVILEPYAALVARDTGRNIKITMERDEVFVSGRTRHAMKMRLRTGVKNNEITTLVMDAVMNAGAYGPHALTVLSNTGSKVLPLFNKIRNMRFNGSSVYTNLPVGGAYRGYGATQGYFALNQQIDIIARRIGADPVEFVKKWHIKEGETSEVFRILGEGTEGVSQSVTSCRLGECIDRASAAIGWSEKRGKHLQTEDGLVRGVGMAVCMQGSGIPLIDMGSCSMKMNEDGSFNLFAGATDIGTGSDTILAQIAAEVLKIPPHFIMVLSSDTDLTPFDVGAYASSTTFVSGHAVRKCAENALEQILEVAAEILDTEKKNLTVSEGGKVAAPSGDETTYADICTHAMYTDNQFQIQAHASSVMPVSPPPFMAQFSEVGVDPETGKIRVLEVVTAIDCGQPLNPKLAEGQIEGAVLNGISYALTEEYLFDGKGRMTNPDFGNYKVFTAPDVPEMKTIIVDSYEESGPFGAKSVGEIGINGPAPSIANAVFDAIGVRIFHTPITPEKVWRGLKNNS
jgi:putative selenate reductase molybdopterin-binding subunit